MCEKKRLPSITFSWLPDPSKAAIERNEAKSYQETQADDANSLGAVSNMYFKQKK